MEMTKVLVTYRIFKNEGIVQLLSLTKNGVDN